MIDLYQLSKGGVLVMIHKAFKFRIYPNDEQKILINKTIGCSRFVFNHFLNLENESYETNKTHLGYYVCAKELTQLKRDEETLWLKEVDSTALQSALRNLDTSFKNFFEKRAKKPRFKSKKNKVQSYITKNNHGSIAIVAGKIKLPKLGLVRYAKSREISGRIMNATVRRNPTGKYFVSLLCETEVSPLPQTESQIGIDLGLSSFGTLNDGSQIENPRFFQDLETKLVKAQRVLSRRVKGSNNWHKQRIKVAKIHEMITNRRLDHLHKLSTDLVKSHDVVCLETLGTKELLQSKIGNETNKSKAQRAKAISDVSWSKFIELLTYKCEWYGKSLVQVNQYFPSTQLCSNCQQQTGPKADLAIRQWTCECGAQHHRDHNAAINILQEGLRLLKQQTAGTAGLA